MANFLGYDNVIKSTTPRNEPIMLKTNKIGNNNSKSISKNFSNDYVANIAQRDQMEIGNQNRVFFLGIKATKVCL